MASWRDGAAYAPIERPDGFASPEVAPLPAEPPQQPATPGSIPAPNDWAANPHSVPLAGLGTVVVSERDPQAPFQTASTPLTSDFGTIDGERDPRVPFQVAAKSSPSPALPSLAPPQGPPLAGPQVPPNHHQLAAPISYPPPMPPTVATNTTLIWLATAFSGLGVLLPPAGALLLFVSGILTVQPKANSKSLGLTSIVMSAIVFLSYAVSDPQPVSALARVLCLVILVWAFVSAVQKSSSR